MFPNHDSIIQYNEAGEVVGWDAPVDPDSYYCDRCGFNHFGECQDETEDGYVWDPKTHKYVYKEDK